MAEATLVNTLRFDEQKRWLAFLAAADEYVRAATAQPGRLEAAGGEYRYYLASWLEACRALKRAQS